MQQAPGFPQHSFSVHVQRQVVKIIDHFVWTHALFPNLLSVLRDYGDADEDVEELCLVMWPTGFPHPQHVKVMEFSLETKQKPTMTEQQVHAFVFK